MCNLYSLTKGQAADWFRARNDRTGNLPLFPGIFPDQLAPIVRGGSDGERELVIARWGMPGPPQYDGAPVTNIHNVSSGNRRGWLGCSNRRVVLAASFYEYADARPRSGRMPVARVSTYMIILIKDSAQISWYVYCWRCKICD
jgi:putative SOS response-associated peptidase YedK